MNNQYEEMKELLGLSRKMKRAGVKPNFLNENDAQPQGNDEGNDVEVLGNLEKQQEEEEFIKNVSQQVQFNEFKIYSTKGSINWGGVLLAEQIQWFYALDDTTGCYILTSDAPLQLRDETLETLNKLRGYYDIWYKKWSAEVASRINRNPQLRNQGTEEMQGQEQPTGQPPMNQMGQNNNMNVANMG